MQKTLLDKLDILFEDESKKLFSSLKEKCEERSAAGISQTIGRRFGFLWEEMVKDTYEIEFTESDRSGLKLDMFSIIIETIDDVLKENGVDETKKIIIDLRGSLKELIESGELRIADFTYSTTNGKKCAFEIKWRIRWNDSKTVKAHCIAYHILKSRGYEPIMLIRRPKEESFIETINRFEREGWKVLTGTQSMDFIKAETGTDLDEYIKSKPRFWDILEPFHKTLQDFSLNESDFIF